MVVPDNIFMAVHNGDVGALQEWINSGGDVNGHSDDGASLLEEAFYQRNLAKPWSECFVLLLDKGARFAPDFLRRAVLEDDHKPIVARDDCVPGTVELLLRHGADVNYTDTQGHTILHLVATYAQLHTQRAPWFIPTIVAHGGRVDAKTTADSINWSDMSMDSAGSTPLMLAATRPYRIDVVRQLLRCGADINATCTVGTVNPRDSTAADFATGYLRHPNLNDQTRPQQEAIATLLREIERAGSFKKWGNAPRVQLLILRKLVERGRATAPRGGVLERLFPAPRAAPGPPDVLFWKILSFWRTSRDDDEYVRRRVYVPEQLDMSDDDDASSSGEESSSYASGLTA